MSVCDDFLGGIVEAVAMAVRARGHSRRDDGVASLTDFVEGGIIDDFLSPGGSIGHVLVCHPWKVRDEWAEHKWDSAD